jgi:hypothetical protein
LPFGIVVRESGRGGYGTGPGLVPVCMYIGKGDKGKGRSGGLRFAIRKQIAWEIKKIHATKFNLVVY